MTLSSLAYLLCVPGIPAAGFMLWIHCYIRGRDRSSRRPFEEMQRPAGWSLQCRTNELFEKATTNLIIAMLTGAWVFLSISLVKSSPVPIIAIGFIACSFFLYRASRLLIQSSNHRLGLSGEQIVGQILDRLSSDSIRVFHDLEIKEPGKKPWNIDHVVLTPAGVFCIETKCRRKPRATAHDGQRGHKLIFDGQQIIFPHSMQPDRHGLDQAQNNAAWLGGKLSALNGTPISVTPVLVFPGWWVDAKGKGPVSVLSHKGLPNFLTGRATILSDQQFRAISCQLDERCRIDLTQPA